jgi:hypothetical protein
MSAEHNNIIRKFFSRTSKTKENILSKIHTLKNRNKKSDSSKSPIFIKSPLLDLNNKTAAKISTNLKLLNESNESANIIQETRTTPTSDPCTQILHCFISHQTSSMCDYCASLINQSKQGVKCQSNLQYLTLLYIA